MNPFYLLAALADLAAVLAHGVVGHRIFLTPMHRDRLFSTVAFGDTGMSRRVLVVTWHAVTATFAISAGMMFLLAFGIVKSEPTALFVAAMHASILLVGLSVAGGQVRHLLRPIPVAFVTCMSTVALMGWLGSS